MKKISEETAFQGRRLKLNIVKYQRDDGQIITREHVIAGDAVVILAIKENGNVLMIREERTAIGEKVLALPAGRVENGEDPKLAALRELEEETGYKANNICFLRKFYASCGYTDEMEYVYVAKNLEKTHQNLDEDEFLDVVEVPIEKVREMLDTNVVDTASCTIALLHYFLYNNK